MQINFNFIMILFYLKYEGNTEQDTSVFQFHYDLILFKNTTPYTIIIYCISISL